MLFYGHFQVYQIKKTKQTNPLWPLYSGGEAFRVSALSWKGDGTSNRRQLHKLHKLAQKVNRLCGCCGSCQLRAADITATVVPS